MRTPENAINPVAPPNSLSCDELLRHPDERGSVAIESSQAGWHYLSFRAASVTDGESVVLDPAQEHAVVLIAGGDAALESAVSRPSALVGRGSPFDALPCAWYVPAGSEGIVRGVAARGFDRTLIAIASAPASGRVVVAGAPIAIVGSDVRVEIRGAGNATRQINHIITPDFPADRLEVVEVLTPSGNWSSWPPHKHDVDEWPTEAVLEEIYFYQFRRQEAWGLQRLYRADRSRDCAWEVHTGDLVLVTDGYHPFVAAHGDDAYYLNALAGDRRTMACSFDPDFDWVRDGWGSQQPDPRVPLIGK